MTDIDRGSRNEPENRESKASDAGGWGTSDLERTAWHKAHNQCDRHSFEPHHGDEANADAEKNVI